MDRPDILLALFDDLSRVGGKIGVRPLFSLSLLPEDLALLADLLILPVDLFRKHKRRLLLVEPRVRKDLLIHQLFDISQDLFLSPSRCLGELGNVNILRIPDRFRVLIIALYQIMVFLSLDEHVRKGCCYDRCREKAEKRTAYDPVGHQVKYTSQQHRNTDKQSADTSDHLAEAALLTYQFLHKRRLPGGIRPPGLGLAAHALAVSRAL